jgi:hypothetical protein
MIIEVPGYGTIDLAGYCVHGMRNERSLVVRANTRLVNGLVTRGKPGTLSTDLVIQDLVLLVALLETAKEPDDIRILIKHEWKPADELSLRTFCKEVRYRTELRRKFRC